MAPILMRLPLKCAFTDPKFRRYKLFDIWQVSLSASEIVQLQKKIIKKIQSSRHLTDLVKCLTDVIVRSLSLDFCMKDRTHIDWGQGDSFVNSSMVLSI